MGQKVPSWEGKGDIIYGNLNVLWLRITERERERERERITEE